jgi:AcrR family transcriptional regulator
MAKAAETRERILDVAEELFGAHGIDGVAMTEVTRRAGHSTRGAVQRYFGSRADLVVAIIARRRYTDGLRRNIYLDLYEQSSAPDLRSLSRALVVPLAANLWDPHGSRGYLRISAEYYLRTPIGQLRERPIPDPSWDRWSRLLSELAPDHEATLPSRFAAIRLTLTELARRAAVEDAGRHDLFVAHLTDLVSSLLSTSLSLETERYLIQGR